jgi:carboxyl-terminal processing protease
LGSGKITTQGYYLPGGTSPQKVGVEANIVLPSLLDAVEDILESDLDNALTLRRVNAASNFAPRQYVTPQIVAELKRRSDQRVREDEEFIKEQDKILAYKESRAKRTTSLNEEKYLEEMKRFNSDEWEKEELDDMSDKDKKIKRDFYVEEVLALTVDYVNLSQELGVAYPKERTIQPPARRRIFGLGF